MKVFSLLKNRRGFLRWLLSRGGAADENKRLIHLYDTTATAPTKLLSVFRPIQDLGEYGEPWAGGTKRNIYDAQANLMSGTSNGITRTKANGQQTVTGTASVTTKMAMTYTIWLQDLGAYTVQLESDLPVHWALNGLDIGKTATFTIAAAAQLSIQMDITAGESYAGTVSKIQVERGTEMTKFIPYANICPITGHGANSMLYVRGRNLWKYSGTNQYSGVNFQREDGTVTYSGTATADAWALPGTMNNMRKGTYRITYTGELPFVVRYNGAVISDENGVFELTEESQSIYISAHLENGKTYDGTANVMVSDLQNAEWAKSVGADYYKSWSAVGNMYDGELDWLTGNVISRAEYINKYSGQELPGRWISDRDAYRPDAVPTTGAQVVYWLTEPKTAALGATAIKLMQGETVVWAQTGELEIEP